MSSSDTIRRSSGVRSCRPNSWPPQARRGRGASSRPGMGKCLKTLRLLQFGPPTKALILFSKAPRIRPEYTPLSDSISRRSPLFTSISRRLSGSPPCCWKALFKVNPSSSPANEWTIRPSRCAFLRNRLFKGSVDHEPGSTTRRFWISAGRVRRAGWLLTRSLIHWTSASNFISETFGAVATSISSMRWSAKERETCGHPAWQSVLIMPRTGCWTWSSSSSQLNLQPSLVRRSPIGTIGSMSLLSDTRTPPGVSRSLVDSPFAKVTEIVW